MSMQPCSPRTHRRADGRSFPAAPQILICSLSCTLRYYVCLLAILGPGIGKKQAPNHVNARRPKNHVGLGVGCICRQHGGRERHGPKAIPPEETGCLQQAGSRDRAKVTFTCFTLPRPLCLSIKACNPNANRFPYRQGKYRCAVPHP